MRNRGRYSLIIIIIVLVGLPTRMDILPLPYPVLKYGGGMLWAAMIYFILAWIFPGAKIRTLWLGAIMVSCGIEFSQLYHTDSLDAFRATLVGRMTIGRGFLWEDVISYLIGVSAAALLEYRWLRQQAHQADLEA